MFPRACGRAHIGHVTLGCRAFVSRDARHIYEHNHHRYGLEHRTGAALGYGGVPIIAIGRDASLTDACAVVAFALYVASTYTYPDEIFYAEIALTGMFVIDYAIKWLMTRNKLHWIWSLQALIDMVSIVPTIAAIIVRYGALGTNSQVRMSHDDATVLLTFGCGAGSVSARVTRAASAADCAHLPGVTLRGRREPEEHHPVVSGRTEHHSRHDGHHASRYAAGCALFRVCALHCATTLTAVRCAQSAMTTFPIMRRSTLWLSRCLLRATVTLRPQQVRVTRACVCSLSSRPTQTCRAASSPSSCFWRFRWPRIRPRASLRCRCAHIPRGVPATLTCRCILQSEYDPRKGKLKFNPQRTHLIITGSLYFTNVLAMFREIFHEDRHNKNIRCGFRASMCADRLLTRSTCAQRVLTEPGQAR